MEMEQLIVGLFAVGAIGVIWLMVKAIKFTLFLGAVAAFVIYHLKLWPYIAGYFN